jgi:hypothetical protein
MRDPSLRDELLETCRASGADARGTLQAAIDLIMLAVCLGAPTIDDAERDITKISECMRANIRRAYSELHDLLEAQRSPRQ